MRIDNYSQRSHLARIKGRVNKGMMPFSRSRVAGRLSMAEPQVPANAVPEAQAVLQNDPPPDAAQGGATITATSR